MMWRLHPGDWTTEATGACAPLALPPGTTRLVVHAPAGCGIDVTGGAAEVVRRTIGGQDVLVATFAPDTPPLALHAPTPPTEAVTLRTAGAVVAAPPGPGVFRPAAMTTPDAPPTGGQLIALAADGKLDQALALVAAARLQPDRGEAADAAVAELLVFLARNRLLRLPSLGLLLGAGARPDPATADANGSPPP